MYNAPLVEIGNDLDSMPFLWPTATTPDGKPFINIRRVSPRDGESNHTFSSRRNTFQNLKTDRQF